MTDTDQRYMKLALALGARGQGRVWPNPAVGCVIVKDGRIVGRGRTADGGRPHAETEALAQAGEAARGATVYVTLEPCSHHGRTPPCADALAEAGVGRVVVAARDPNPAVDGQGVARLLAAGIEVTEGICRDEAKVHHRGFILTVTERRPFVTLKLAASLDGRIATATGESQWITGPEARRMVHAMRARHDAVMVGGGTARADDPSLTVRDMGITRQPVRVVLSRRLDLPLGGKLAASAREVPVWLVHGPDAEPGLIRAWQDIGATLLPAPVGLDRQVDAAAALGVLAKAGLTRVFCEGGGMLAASLLNGGLVDELALFTAGKVLGAEGRPLLGAMGIDRLAHAPQLKLVETRAVGADTLSVWKRA